LRYDDDDFDDDESNNFNNNMSASTIDLSDVKDDVFMGYNEDQDAIKNRPMQFKVEIDDEEIDQVVPTIPTSCPHDDYEISCEDSSLDVIVLYVN